MQASTNANLFQTSFSEALGTYRSRKAIFTSGLPSSSSTTSSSDRARWGYPIHLNPSFSSILSNASDLAVEGSGADGGRYRVLSLKVKDGAIWTSEAGGVVRQIGAETGKTINLYKGAKAPVTSFDFTTGSEGEEILVTGSWDKAIRLYKFGSESPVLTVESAMGDFIKSLHCFSSSGRQYVVTGGSDKSLMLWHLSSNPTTLKCVHQSRAHTRPVNALASLVGLDGEVRVYSADSMGRILASTISDSRLEVVREIQGFSTAVYDLKVGWRREEVEGEQGERGDRREPAEQREQSKAGTDAFLSLVKEDPDGSRYRLVAELWAASGDKSAAGYRLSPLLQPPSPSRKPVSTQILGREEPLSTPYRKLVHKDYVKSVLPLALSLPTSWAGYEEFKEAVVTAGSDEHLHLHRGEGEEKEKEIEGHWHEVTSLACWVREPTPGPSIQAANGEIGEGVSEVGAAEGALPPARQSEVWIVSAGLDGSIRRWDLASMPNLPAVEMRAPIEDRKGNVVGNDWNESSIPTISGRRLGDEEPIGKKGRVQMTAEEEAELAELMGSDDDD